MEDSIWIFLDGPSPFVVRRDDEEDFHLLIGDAFVDGLINGEAMDEEDFCHDFIKLY